MLTLPHFTPAASIFEAVHTWGYLRAQERVARHLFPLCRRAPARRRLRAAALAARLRGRARRGARVEAALRPGEVGIGGVQTGDFGRMS